MRLNQIVEKFYEVEKVRTGKLFLRYLRLRNPDIEKYGIIAYSYIRWLDDLVDSGTDPNKAADILTKEEGMMKRVAQGEEFDSESYQYLSKLHQRYGDRIFELFQKFIDGFRAYNGIIMSGNPLDKQSFVRRTIDHTLPCFQVVSLIAYGRELQFPEDFKRLMIAWSYYDGLQDIREDLSAGLILFPKEELDCYGVDLHRGQPLPVSFRRMYDQVRKKTIKDLLLHSSSVEMTNLPALERVALHGYFLSRAIKLAASQYPFTEQGIVVGVPKDNQSLIKV
ncbi:MAG: hypothetical protein AABX32_04600 [Nanoarchaeota archaeon]